MILQSRFSMMTDIFPQFFLQLLCLWRFLQFSQIDITIKQLLVQLILCTWNQLRHPDPDKGQIVLTVVVIIHIAQGKF